MTTYYVSDTKGNDNNPGTTDLPFKTIYKGINISINGDTIKVQAGIYYPTFSTRPIINKSISVIGEGKSNTIIDGKNITGWATDWKQGLVELTGDNSSFQGFTVQNVIPGSGGQGASGICVSSTQNVIVEKNLVKNIWSSGIQAYGSSSKYSKNVAIRYNEIDHACNGGDPTKSRQETLSVGHWLDGFEISYNYIHDSGYIGAANIQYGGEGLDTKEYVRNGKIHHNYLYNTRSVGIYIDGYDNIAQDIEVYQNITEKIYAFENSSQRGVGIALATEAGGTDQRVNLHDNISYNNALGIEVCLESGSGGKINDITLNSNICYNNSTGIKVKSCGAILANIQLTNNYSNISIDSGASLAVTQSGNITDATQIKNVFDSKYNMLKADILGQINPTPTILASIQISVSENLSIGSTKQLAAICKDQNNNVIVCPILTWESSNNSVVTVDSSGKISGIMMGSANITASSGSITSNISMITVKTLDVIKLSLSISVGTIKQLTVKCSDTNKNVIVCPTLSWSSNNISVATVDSSGKVKGIAKGAANITTSSGSIMSNLFIITVV